MQQAEKVRVAAHNAARIFEKHEREKLEEGAKTLNTKTQAMHKDTEEHAQKAFAAAKVKSKRDAFNKLKAAEENSNKLRAAAQTAEQKALHAALKKNNQQFSDAINKANQMREDADKAVKAGHKEADKFLQSKMAASPAFINLRGNLLRKLH